MFDEIDLDEIRSALAAELHVPLVIVDDTEAVFDAYEVSFLVEGEVEVEDLHQAVQAVARDLGRGLTVDEISHPLVDVRWRASWSPTDAQYFGFSQPRGQRSYTAAGVRFSFCEDQSMTLSAGEQTRFLKQFCSSFKRNLGKDFTPDHLKAGCRNLSLFRDCESLPPRICSRIPAARLSLAYESAIESIRRETGLRDLEIDWTFAS